VTEGTAGGHAARVAAGILLTRVLGYVRERLIAHFLGNGAAVDAFRAAYRIPNMIRNLLGEGTLSASFIPVYAGLEARGDRAGARAVAGAVLGLLLVAAGVFAVVGIGLAPAVTTAVAAGFDAPTRRLAIAMVRILFPMTGLMVVSAWCLGVLNTHRRFFLPYAAPALWNVAGIAALAGAGSWAATSGLPADERAHVVALALAWGTVAGAVLQVAVQLPTCWRLLGGHVPLRPSVALAGVRDVISAWTPVVLGAGVAQISSLIDTQLGSFTGEGGVASLAYAQLVQTLPVSLFGASVAAVALPALSRDATAPAASDALRARLGDGFGRIAYFVLPAAFAFAALGQEIVGTLFQTGRFGGSDTVLVGRVLAAYSIGLFGQATVKVLASGFYALRDTRTPVRVSIATLALSTTLAIVLIRPLGPVGIALAASVGGAVAQLAQLGLLERRLGPIVSRGAWGRVALAAGAALAAAAAGRGASALTAGLGPVPHGLLAMGACGATYFLLTTLTRHPEAVRLWTRLR
jgi:putative peptidoglycan lipid II flippase